MNRPAMKELIRLVGEKKIQAVYVVHSDRIGRDVKDFLVFKELLKKQEIELKSIYEPMLDESATGVTMSTIMMAFSQMQRLVTAEKVQGVMREIARAGYFPTYPPAGYVNAKNPDKTITGIGRNIIAIDPIMGPLVTDLFHRYARGDVNVYELADVMYARGLRNQRGRKVQSNSMYAMLHNRIYLGEIHWGGVDVVEGKHEPLIDERTFNQVQAVFQNKNGKACRRRKYKWLLAGFAYCPRHNRRFSAEWHMQKKKAYYHCTNRTGCGKYVEQVTLEDRVAEKFIGLQFSEEFTKLVIEKAQGIFLERRNKYEAQRKGLVNRRTALESRRKTAEEKLFAGTLTDEDFTRIRRDIQVDLSHIDDEFALLEDQRELNVDVAQEILLLARNIYKAYQKASFDLKRQYLSFFWERFEVLDGIIIRTVPPPLFEALLTLEAAFYREQKEEKPKEIAYINTGITNLFGSAHLGSNQGPYP